MTEKLTGEPTGRGADWREEAPDALDKERRLNAPPISKLAAGADPTPPLES